MCCVRIKDYKSANKIYLRALEYCWFLKDKDKELEIYDKMGYVFFNMEKIEEAKYYHARVI